MPNVILQDVNAIIHGTSKYGLSYDIAHVTMLIRTDTPIPHEMEWAIPHVEEIPQKAINLIKDGTTAIYPMLKSKLREDINNILDNVDNNNQTELLEDIEKALLLTSMHVTPIEHLENNDLLYVVSYKYRLYPVEPNNFDFKVLIPFDGLDLASNGRLQVTLVAPINATINPEITKGENPSTGEHFQETIVPLSSVSKNVVNFVVQQDPIFTIRYYYQ